MNRPMRLFILGAAIFGASSAMADVTFFEGDNFNGRQITVDRSVPNFTSVGFNDRAQSAIVEGGSWEVCVDRDFGGGCTVLTPGRYPSLAGWSGRVSSARQVTAGPAAVAPPRAAGGGITLYASEDFGGREVAADRAFASLESRGFNDRHALCSLDLGMN